MNQQLDLGQVEFSGTQAAFSWRLVAVISVMLMELSLIVPWLWLIARPLNPVSQLWLLLWFLSFALAARGLNRLINHAQLRRGVALSASGVLLGLGLLLSLNLVDGSRALFDFAGALRSGIAALPSLYPMAPELPIMVLVVFIWRRGVAAASSTIIEPARTGFKFRIGVLVLIGLAVVDGDKSSVPTTIPLFFLSSLLAMSLTRADYLSKLRGASDPPFSAQWLLSLLGLFLSVVLTGLGLGRLLGSALAYRTLESVRAGFIDLLGFLYRLSLPLLVALEPLFQGLIGRFRRFFLQLEGGESQSLTEPGGAAGQLEGLQPPEFFQRLNELLASLRPYWPIVRTGLIVLVFGLILVSAVRMIQRRSQQSSRRRRPTDEGHGLPVELEFDLRRQLQRWRQELRSWGQAVMSGQLSTAILVRRLYRRLLELAAEYGRSRYRWETPLEFQEALARLFPEVTEEIDTITDAYVKVRYGELAESADLVNDVQHAWDRILNEYR